MTQETREKQFYDALCAVPEVPSGIYREIARRTRRPGIFYRIALAACLVLAIGITSAMFVRFGPPSSAAYAGSGGQWDELVHSFNYVDGDFDGDFLIVDNQLAIYIEEGISND